MAFISNKQKMLNKRVRLTRDINVIAGTFQRGTEMRIIDNGPRGYDLVDNEGNKLLETGLLGNFFEEII